jgi:hypothetical protein
MKRNAQFKNFWAHFEKDELERRRANLLAHYRNTKNKLKCNISVLNSLGALAMKDGHEEDALAYWDLVFQIEKSNSMTNQSYLISPESRDPRTSGARLLEIANSGTLDASDLDFNPKNLKASLRWAEFYNLCQNPSTPLEILNAIAEIDDQCSSLGENIGCTSELLWKSATNGGDFEALNNPAVPIDLIEEVFISSHNFWEHKAIARNLATPTDDYFLVYAGLKSSEKATGIKFDTGYKIQMELIENPVLPPIVISALSKSTNSRLLKKIETWKLINQG